MIGAAHRIPEDNKIEVAIGNSRAAQHRQLGNGKILAIALAGTQRLISSRPDVGAAPADRIVDKMDSSVDVPIDCFEAFDRILAAQAEGELGGNSADRRVLDLMP